MMKTRAGAVPAKRASKPRVPVTRTGNGAVGGRHDRAAEPLGLVLEALPVGVLMVDRAGAITLVNAQGERILGYTRQELVGRPVEILLPERLRGRHVDDRNG